MLKERDNLRYSDLCLLKTGPKCGSLSSSTNWGVSRKCIGTYKSIDSVYTGSFTPGIFRVNPVTIRSGQGSVASGIMAGCSSSHSMRITGPLAIAQTGPLKQYGSFRTDLKSISDNRCLSKLNQADTDAAIFLGELGQTLAMLKNPLRGLNDFLRNRNLRSLFTLSSNQWLQYRYGILPFLSDIRSAIELYNRCCESIDNRMRRCTAGASDTSTTSTVFDDYFVINIAFNWRRTVVTTHTSHSHAYYNVLTNDLAARDLGLNLGNVANVVWELVPYSFVVDWFLSVGSWLKALNPNPNYRHLGGCTSQKITISESVEIYNPRPRISNYSVTEWSPGSYSWRSDTLVRQVGFPTVSSPWLNKGILNFKRILDSVALLWGRLK